MRAAPLGVLTGRLRERAPRRFDALQIEVTSRCNLRCVMCPVTVLGGRWHSRHLPWTAFLRIARAFPQARFVHLQGWGEPLLHPQFFAMVETAKRAGCRVGFTTNGTLLGAAAERVLDAGVDLVAVSVAGATADTHRAIRVGSDLAQVLDNLRRLLGLRAERRTRRPEVELFFLMAQTNLAELPAVVDLAAALGVDELVATNLDYVATGALDELRAFGCSPRRAAFGRAVEAARAQAAAAGLAFRAYPLDPEEVAVCDANPLRILFVASDGQVSPCPYLGLAGQTEVPRFSEGRTLCVPRVSFGDVRERDLLDLWEAPAYRAFRERFAARRRSALVSAVAAAAGVEAGAPAALPAPPEACRSCPKLLGL